MTVRAQSKVLIRRTQRKETACQYVCTGNTPEVTTGILNMETPGSINNDDAEIIIKSKLILSFLTYLLTMYSKLVSENGPPRIHVCELGALKFNTRKK